MREHYDQPPLRRADLSGSPFEQFSKWLEDAVKAEIYDPNACSLATVDGEGRPVSRAVLLKALEDEQFVFYTNYQSRKSSHLDQNPNTCMHFPWFALQRQVVVTGKVEKLKRTALRNTFFPVRWKVSWVPGHPVKVSGWILANHLKKPTLKCRKNLETIRPSPHTGEVLP